MAARELSNRLYGSRACVVTDTKRFVSDEFMVSSLDPNLEVGGTLRVHYYNNLSFYFRSILSNNHNPALDKLKVFFYLNHNVLDCETEFLLPRFQRRGRSAGFQAFLVAT